MSDRTLVLLKPDAVERKLVGEIVARIEAKNLDIVAMDLRQLDTDILGRHYAEHVGKGFYDELVAFMSRWSGGGDGRRGAGGHLGRRAPDDGRHQPPEGGAGTIRGDLGILFTENLVHGSDSLDSAEARDRHLLPELVTSFGRAKLSGQLGPAPATISVQGFDKWHVTTR